MDHFKSGCVNFRRKTLDGVRGFEFFVRSYKKEHPGGARFFSHCRNFFHMFESLIQMFVVWSRLTLSHCVLNETIHSEWENYDFVEVVHMQKAVYRSISACKYVTLYRKQFLKKISQPLTLCSWLRHLCLSFFRWCDFVCDASRKHQF